jgi:hypothetical protein
VLSWFLTMFTNVYYYYYYFIIIIIICSGTAAHRGLWPPHPRGLFITHNDVPQSVGLLWTSDQLVAETFTCNTQNTQQSNIHGTGGIRTHDRSRRATVDLRLRPRYITRLKMPQTVGLLWVTC